MQCKHEWKEVSRVREASTFEKLAELGILHARTENVPAHTVLIIACTKCGKIKKYTV